MNDLTQCPECSSFNIKFYDARKKIILIIVVTAFRIMIWIVIRKLKTINF